MNVLTSICEKEIRIQGRLLHIAKPDADRYHFLEDPQSVLDGLRKCRERVDIFTFMQIMPETSPKYSYPMEWDNLAVLPITTFDEWWTKLKSTARNRARQAEKKGVMLREVPFDDLLVRGIWQIYNETPVRQG